MTASIAASSQPGSTYRADIDGLRAMAILLVVAFHAGVDRFAGGYVGVDVFFVLSGFLITGLLVKQHARDGRISLRDFYARRARRLLPLAGLVLISTMTLGIWLLPPLGRIDLLRDVRSAAFYLANWRFASQATAYSDAEVTDSLLLHFWSLSIEEQFYVLWPMLIILAGWLVRRHRRELFVPVLAALLAIVVALSLFASVMLTPRLGPEAYYVTYTRLWEMGIGAGLALALPRWRALPRPVAEATAFVGIGAIVASAISYDASTAFPGWAAVLPVLGTALLIASAHGGTTIISRWLSLKPMTTLGRWSYAWYLWHWPLIGVSLLLNARLPQPLSPALATAGGVGLSLVLAALSHHLVENPIRFASSLQYGARRSLVLGAGLTIVPVAAASSYLLLGDVGDVAPAPSTMVAENRIGGLSEEWRHLEATKGPMTPREAAEDHIDLGPSDNGCHLDQDDAEARVDCVYGDPAGAVSVVLIGDSHARHWLPALDEVARHRGWRLISATKSACTPIDVRIWNSSFEREYEECEQWRDSLVSQLQDDPSVEAVIISRSRGYRGSLIDEGGRRVSGLDEVYDAWERGAERSFETFSEITDEIVVFRDTPWSPEVVATCLSEANGRRAACDFPLASAAGADAGFYAAEWKAAPDNVMFVDPTFLVCSTDPCQVVAFDGTIKYRDGHHLTQTFSRQLAPLLDDLLPEQLAEGVRG